VFKGSLLALDTPTALRRKLFGRTVVFHLAEMQSQYKQAITQFSFVQSAEVVDNKLVVGLDDPETHNPEVIKVLVEAGAKIQFVGEVRQRLEDVYLKLVKSS
jgi:ABC-2 type transport system ATP-binding protein